ncbi:hypothetical protein Slin15195_G069850 [Septoria linicola]|uniref:Invertebrate defensins family profile domain-containing protein n=1 Tax=Septoria linicola TaxID=215465 RepID=A0A9Q9AZS5_9PEZI|nr:hypothetical protein Slin14017_G102590 [Septoria linicola]USW53666.1 hypothetical protein Slin15195_G069850 [Septoria linicola]
MHFSNIIAALVAFVTFTVAAPVEERQLNGALLCPLLGTPLCNVQCMLVTQTSGQCAPNRKCFCADDAGTILE